MAAEATPDWPETITPEKQLYIRRKVHPIMSPLIESVTFSRPDDPEDFMTEYFLGGVVSPKTLAVRMSRMALLSPDSKLIMAHSAAEESDGAWTEAEVASHYKPYLTGAYEADTAESLIAEIIAHLLKTEPDRVAAAALKFVHDGTKHRKSLGLDPVDRSGTPELSDAPGTPKAGEEGPKK